MPKTCYVKFDANPNAEYAYQCGALEPQSGHLVVIELKDLRKKLVMCTRISEDVDPLATKPIFATLQEQF